MFETTPPGNRCCELWTPLGKHTTLERIDFIVRSRWENVPHWNVWIKLCCLKDLEADPRQPVLVPVQVAQGALRGSVCLLRP